VVNLTIEWNKRTNHEEEGCLEVEKKNGVWTFNIFKKYQNNYDCFFI
jgi:hypothetical protein